jgi:regulator of protease activity HflC (stomatin/prohibitin superfamily)
MENKISPRLGLTMLFFSFFFMISGFMLGIFLAGFHSTEVIGGVLMPISLMVPLFLLMGLFIVNPNDSRVLVLFGKYAGTVKDNGFYWVNPFYSKRLITLKARNFESDRLKVNDKSGNPIVISVIIVWKVSDTFKAAFDVDDYVHFVKLQSDAALRYLCSLYAYDNFTDDANEITLRSGTEEVNEELEKQLDESLKMVGIEVVEARIGYLAYAPEIASAMLQRQQAEAVVAARFKIVEGAVGMVEKALTNLSSKNIVEFSSQQKAALVSNLMIVLCSDKETVPVVNVGN